MGCDPHAGQFTRDIFLSSEFGVRSSKFKKRTSQTTVLQRRTPNVELRIPNFESRVAALRYSSRPSRRRPIPRCQRTGRYSHSSCSPNNPCGRTIMMMITPASK